MTVDALKAIYVALGGSADTVADMVIIPDVLFEIAKLIEEKEAAEAAEAEAETEAESST